MAKHIRIVAKREGFRRAGIAHSESATFHPIDRFTPEQLDQLKAEPMLIVDEMDPPDEKPVAKGAGKAAGASG